MTGQRSICIHGHRDRVIISTESTIDPGQQIQVWGYLIVGIVRTRHALSVSIEVHDCCVKALFGHIGATHPSRANTRAVHQKISGGRGPEGAGVRRARPLNQSSQNVGIVSGRIEQPIRAVLENQSRDGATGTSRARPVTFRRGGRGLRQIRNGALAIPAATGGGSEPTIEAVGEAATGHQAAHQAECQKASKTICPGHVHGCRLNNAQAVPCVPG